MNLEFDPGSVRVGVCVTARRKVHVTLTCKGQTVIEEQAELAPGEPLVRTIAHSAAQPEEYRLCVLDSEGKGLIAYQPQTAADRTLPGPATEPPPPGEIASADELYVTGLHLEQYRHATRSAEDTGAKACGAMQTIPG